MPADAATDKPTDKAAKSDPKYLWVTNNTDHVIGLGLRPRKQPGSNTLSSPEQLVLTPGAQVVDRAVWERWKDENPDVDGEQGEVTRMLKTPIPRDPHRDRRAEKAGEAFLVEGPLVKSKASPLGDVDVEKARALVPEIRTEQSLRQLLQIERRGPVIEALRSALEEFDRGQRRPLA
jgi:hypothetical protein